MVADQSARRTGFWLAFLAGAVAVLALALAWLAWSRGERAAEKLSLNLPVAPTLPDAPPLPDAPKLPDAPVPKPR